MFNIQNSHMLQEILIPLISLILLEVILGIDNILFISILSSRLPEAEQKRLRYWGLGLALIMRLIFLTTIFWIMQLNTPLFSVMGLEVTGKELILLSGGLFLIYKTIKELYHFNQHSQKVISNDPKEKNLFRKLLVEIILIDLVFSIDSIITAVGMVDKIWIMYLAVIVSMIIMLVASNPINNFVQQYPSFKILALCFLIAIGISLVAEAFNIDIPKAYIYSSILFALFVDILQWRLLREAK